MSAPPPESASPGEYYRVCLALGHLVFQECGCGNRWLPPRTHCPRCLGTEWSWKDASGRGKLASWVVYHVAYDDSVSGKLPYNVAIVELEEGPRLITNIVDHPHGAGLTVGAELAYVAVHDSGPARSQFRLISDR